jgi:hypothetical protein
MPSIEERIPSMTDQELLNLFENATGKLLDPKHAAAAGSALAAIDHEWKKRLEGARAKLSPDESPSIGMLATLGYRVGTTNGETKAIRRRILKHVIEGNLPLVGSPGYTSDWGLPNSTKRYSKLIQFLESQLANPANREHERAIIEWGEDLDWARQNYPHLSR